MFRGRLCSTGQAQVLVLPRYCLFPDYGDESVERVEERFQIAFLGLSLNAAATVSDLLGLKLLLQTAYLRDILKQRFWTLAGARRDRGLLRQGSTSSTVTSKVVEILRTSSQPLIPKSLRARLER